MLSLPHMSDVLKSGGFLFHNQIGRVLKVGFLAQCCLISFVAAIVILIASMIDHSLILSGRDVGLLQHPGIWFFFSLQIVVPVSIKHSLRKLLKSRTRIREISTGMPFRNAVTLRLLEFLRLKDHESKFWAVLVYCVGLSGFIWNTYQNQLPGIIVPYDFWDSKSFLWGFWATRAYKLYIFGWLFPYVALIHVAILIVTLRLIRQARLSGNLKFLPFHPDGAGGLGFVPGLVTTPVIITMLMASLSTAAAFEVHRAADATPLLGVAFIILCSAISYALPIFHLRKDIVSMKQEMIQKLRRLQQTYYSKIMQDYNLNFDVLRQGNEALDYFEKICLRIASISNYPHLKRFIKYTGLALTPSIISFTIKLYQTVSTLIDSKKP